MCDSVTRLTKTVAGGIMIVVVNTLNRDIG